MKIKCINGKIELPEEFVLKETKRRLTIKMPWSVSVDILLKNGQIQTTQWFRQKGKDKPYVPEGTILIDGFVYEVEIS